MNLKCEFRGEKIEASIDYKSGKNYNLDFNGNYLVEIRSNLVPTGRAINGYGDIIKFNISELKLEEKKEVVEALEKLKEIECVQKQ